MEDKPLDWYLKRCYVCGEEDACNACSVCEKCFLDAEDFNYKLERKISDLELEVEQLRRLRSSDFANAFQIYIKSSDKVQSVICDMCEVTNDPESDQDEIDAALATLSEALLMNHIPPDNHTNLS